jgi:YVTN family beta-propeller protein
MSLNVKTGRRLSGSHQGHDWRRTAVGTFTRLHTRGGAAMSRRRSLCVALLASMVATGCAGLTGTGLADRTAPLKLAGFSVMPPTAGWEIPPRLLRGRGYSGDLTGFPLAALDAGQVRAGEVSFLHPSSGTVAHARTVSNRDPRDGTPGDLVTLTRAEFERRKTGAAGHRVLDFSVTPDASRGANCLRYELTQETPVRQGEAYVLREVQGFRCPHPHWPTYGIDLGYGRARRPGQVPTPPGVEVNRFLSSLTFTTIKPVLETSLAIESASVGLAVGADGVWMTLHDRAQAIRIDPMATQVLATVPVGRHPFGLAVGEDSVWVANQADGTVSRIDLRTNRVSATIPVGNRPSYVPSGPTRCG